MLNKENQENYYSNKLELVGPSFEELSLEEMEA
ncbi:lantipeptide cytolysin subunit CylL-S, partial [Enterococcus faecalis]|nr:lantipeptide cytolysin subunit CylL-S [Enterococcus faecalis]